MKFFSFRHTHNMSGAGGVSQNTEKSRTCFGSDPLQTGIHWYQFATKSAQKCSSHTESLSHYHSRYQWNVPGGGVAPDPADAAAAAAAPDPVVGKDFP